MVAILQALLMERLMFSSDKFDVHVCQDCGLIGYKGWCQHCKTSARMANIKVRSRRRSSDWLPRPPA